MDVKKEQKIKAQEWVVMFDGQIKRSETEIDANQHHLEVNRQKNEQKLQFGFTKPISENVISVDIVNIEIWRIKSNYCIDWKISFEFNRANLGKDLLLKPFYFLLILILR